MGNHKSLIVKHPRDGRRYLYPKKQTGGSGQFAKIDYEIVPGEQNSGYIFESHVTGGNVPREYCLL